MSSHGLVVTCPLNLVDSLCDGWTYLVLPLIWVRQAERDQGKRPGPTTDERERIKALEREVRELRQANEILRKASAYFAQAELDRPFRK